MIIFGYNFLFSSGMYYSEGYFKLPGIKVKITKFFKGGLVSSTRVWSHTKMSFIIESDKEFEIFTKNAYIKYLGKKHNFFKEKTKSIWKNNSFIHIDYNQDDSKGHDTRYVSFFYKYRKGKSKSIKVNKTIELKLKHVSEYPKVKE